MPVTVAAFNPRLYQVQAPVAAEADAGGGGGDGAADESGVEMQETKTCYCAIGSTDGVYAL